jgi:cell division protein FtsZ
MIHFDMPPQKSNIMKVLGFGGGGSNAVNHMYGQGIQNVDFIICNTDAKALANSQVPNKVQLGPHLTQGLGAGAKPEVGRDATMESLEEIRSMMEVNTRMAFITAGMGGGTGTGSAPIVAKMCRDLNILTVGIVTTPFSWEGPKRMKQAQEGINELKSYVDTLLVISNDKLRHQFGNLKMKEAFAKADDVLSTAARCITDVINSTGHVGIDFADVCTVMKDGGVAILGSSSASGEDRALTAIAAAINSPLLNDNDISGAKWILLNITSAEGEHEYTVDEVEVIQDYIRQQTGENTDIILGMGFDESLGTQLGITIIATGFQHHDPFAKPEPVKVEVKPEVPIIMTLGVEGEEKKMFAPVQHQAAPQEVVATAVPMPVIMDEIPVAPQPTYTPPPTSTYSYNPVVSNLEEQEEDETPLVFELSVDVPETPQQPTADKPVEPKEWKYEPVKMDANHPMFSNNQPSQPYQQPAKNNAADNINATLQAIRNQTAEPPLEENLRPIIKEQLAPEEEEVIGISLSYDEPTAQPQIPQSQLFVNDRSETSTSDLSEEENQKRRAQERINRLRNLSFNPMNVDNSGEFENVPAYMRRNMELHNSIANVEDFYSRAQVKTDDNNQTSISTLNTFLHGEKPD